MSLADYELNYEDLPPKKYNKLKEGKTVSKAAKATAPTVTKSYNKTRGEHAKDVIIAMLVTSIIAFVAGMQFQVKQHATIEAAKSSTVTTAEVQPEAKK